jgi:hypothetical protein
MRSCFTCFERYTINENPDEAYCEDCLGHMEAECDIDNDLVRIVDANNHVTHRTGTQRSSGQDIRIEEK